jgi:hypothetical protein
MKTVRTNQGPFLERPHFTAEEIDRTCSQELRKAGLLPNSPQPIDIERFIKKRFNVDHQYDDLPEGVLGFTEFGRNGVVRVVVSRSLGEDGSDVARRRERATLAHEAGHGLLHGYLFALAAPNASLFGAANCAQNQVLCREVLQDRSGPTHAKSAWSEYQANQAIGAFLLPRALVTTALKPLMISTGGLGATTLDVARKGEAANLLSSTFDVNPVVARIRLDVMFGAQLGGQMSL